MAIAGLLVHTLEDNLKRIETAIDVMPEMTTYGCHQCQYVVVVAEAPANQMEKTVERISAIDGFLSIYTTYVTVEDEMDS